MVQTINNFSLKVFQVVTFVCIMFLCPICSKHFETSKSYLSHFVFFHSDVIASRTLVCSFPHCERKFSEFKAYSKHVHSHKVKETSRPSNCIVSHQQQRIVHPISSKSSEPMEIEAEQPYFEESQILKNSEEFDQALTNAVVTYLASLYDCSLSEVQIQKIVEAHKQLLGAGFLSVIKSKVLLLLNKSAKHETLHQHEINDVMRMIDACQNMYDGFDTHYQRMKEFENCGAFVQPEPYVIGHGRDERIVNNEVVITPVELTGQFIPMRKVLKGFLELPGVLSTLQDYMCTLEGEAENSDVLSNVVQGRLWQQKIKPKFEGKTVLPLICYFDDYEPNKEKGTHTCVHKLGATYFQIACLPPEFQGLLDNIYLANLFYSNDKAFGNAAIFRKLINELKYLEKEGITVVTAEGCFQIFFALVLFKGDNLGANGILGFVESFMANYYCRVCKEIKAVMQIQTVSNPEKRRTKECHACDVAMANETLTGVKGECVFDELACFDVSENVHLDIMHDLDEGVWNYVMWAILYYFLYTKNRFTLDTLNNLIQGFYYEKSEQGNKPPLITTEHMKKKKKLAFSASEMRCFVRYFGLMVGHLVPEEDSNVWDLYLLARQIIDLVTAPSISLSKVPVLRDLLRRHHQKFLDLFKGHLYPKFHLALHEPDVIPDIGPLEPLSCMRTEGKHKEGKAVARLSSNRINLPYTVAKRHQLKLCFRLLARRGLTANIGSSPIHMLHPHEVKEYDHFSFYLPDDILSTKWQTVKWISINGTKYAEKMIVVHGKMDTGDPLFGSIHCIIQINDSASFIVKCLQTIRFDKHVHAFEVKFTNAWHYVHQRDLLCPVPIDLRTSADGVRKYVCMRYALL